MAPELCPNCGAEVPAGARVCPECGSDEETGWSDAAYADRLGLPDEQFDHDAFVREEFGAARPASRRPAWERWVLAGMALLIILYYVIR